jgi:putative ABC transport system permease protein
MSMFNRVPLAWRQLTNEKLRLLAAVSGIAFAVVLMLVQLGFLDSLIVASSLLQDRLQADLVLTSKQYDYLVSSGYFPRRRVYQALGFDGVESAWPMYLGSAQWKNPENLQERNILAIGYDPASSALALPGLENPRRLLFPDVVLFDALSRPEFGPAARMLRDNRAVTTEVNGRRIKVIGLFQMGVSFGVNGTLITSDLNFLRLFPGNSPALVKLGVIRLKPGADVNRVREQLEKGLPPDVRVLTRDSFSRQEREYWAVHTGIGFIFTLGMFMGFVVGGVIVYQILYTDVTDHLAEYATLKAVGYGNRYFFSVVLQESLILSFFGFLPGLGIAKLLYVITQRATLLPMFMRSGQIVFVFLMTVLMCSGSGMLAMRKVQQAQPAEIF